MEMNWLDVVLVIICVVKHAIHVMVATLMMSWV